MKEMVAVDPWHVAGGKGDKQSPAASWLLAQLVDDTFLRNVPLHADYTGLCRRPRQIPTSIHSPVFVTIDLP
jgi:hypothetical protein